MSKRVVEVFTDEQIEMMISRSQSEVYAYLTPPYYNTLPWTGTQDTVPPTIRWDTAELTYGYLIEGQIGVTQPNQSDAGSRAIDRVIEDLEKIVNCEKGLYDVDSKLIKRDIVCPNGKQKNPTTGVIGSTSSFDSTKDRTIFSLEDVPER
jgi:hypothetical protein